MKRRTKIKYLRQILPLQGNLDGGVITSRIQVAPGLWEYSISGAHAPEPVRKQSKPPADIALRVHGIA